jgi:hypothetical protein
MTFLALMDGISISKKSNAKNLSRRMQGQLYGLIVAATVGLCMVVLGTGPSQDDAWKTTATTTTTTTKPPMVVQ